jgi:hypothetical protein
MQPHAVRPLSMRNLSWRSGPKNALFSFPKRNGTFGDYAVRKSIDNYFVHPDAYLGSPGGLISVLGDLKRKIELCWNRRGKPGKFMECSGQPKEVVNLPN